MKTFLLLLAALLASHSASAQIYRWVDKDGKVNYGDQPPPEVKIDKPNLGPNPAAPLDGSYEARRIAQIAPLTLYTAPDCKDACDKARALLKKRKLPYSEVSITTPEQLAQLSRLTGSKEPQAPTLSVGNKPIEGFAEAPWNAALDVAGFPKAL